MLWSSKKSQRHEVDRRQLLTLSVYFSGQSNALRGFVYDN